MVSSSGNRGTQAFPAELPPAAHGDGEHVARSWHVMGRIVRRHLSSSLVPCPAPGSQVLDLQDQLSLLSFVIPRHSHSHQLPKCPQPMPRPDEWPRVAGRVSTRQWSGTSGGGGAFPSWVSASSSVTWGTPAPLACRRPLHFAVSEPRAAPQPPKPATLRP